jgi:hypothetical protein
MSQPVPSTKQQIEQRLEQMAAESDALASLTIAAPDLSPSDLALVLQTHADVFETHVAILRRYAEANMARRNDLASGHPGDPAINVAELADVDLTYAISSLEITARLVGHATSALVAE